MAEPSINDRKMQALRAQADNNWADADALWEQAEGLIAQALTETPGDASLGDQRAFVSKQRKDISRKVRVGVQGARDDGVAYTAAMAFPHVSRVIDTKFHPVDHPWVEYTEIQTGLLEDRDAREDIEQWAAMKGRTPQQIAVKIQGMWNRAFGETIQPDPTVGYEVRKDGNAYRPRQRG